MSAKIKIDLPAVLAADKPIILDLGCGKHKKPGRIGIDALEIEGVDIIADIDQGLPFFPDSSVDEIHSNHFLEHLRDLETVLTEMGRILKPGGRVQSFVPHFSNPHYYSDYTHKTFFGLYTLDYFTDGGTTYRRQVGCYSSRVRVQVISRRYIFSSRFKLVHLFRKGLQALVNSHPLAQEFYEENLCWMFPCHGLEFIFSAQSLEKASSHNSPVSAATQPEAALSPG